MTPFINSLYTAEGTKTRTDIFIKSFHYLNFQINQALSFTTLELKRAIFALRRSLKDFKASTEGHSVVLPDNFIWGVLSFIKNILQVIIF